MRPGVVYFLLTAAVTPLLVRLECCRSEISKKTELPLLLPKQTIKKLLETVDNDAKVEIGYLSQIRSIDV